MHTFRKSKTKDEFEVGYLQVCERNGEQVFVLLFRGMGLASAIQMVNMLNGGNMEIDNLYAKVLELIVVK